MLHLHNDHILPIIRIQKIILENFKSVKYGEVIFSCGKRFVPQNTTSDILGIYGQNGSGKTSIIEALGILRYALRGATIPKDYVTCIAVHKDYAYLEFNFDFQYPDEKQRTVVYSFKLTEDVVEEFEDEIVGIYGKRIGKSQDMQLKIFDESISVSGWLCGDEVSKQNIITSGDSSSYPIGPSRKISEYVGSMKSENGISLAVSKKLAAEKSQSFIFRDDTMGIFYSGSGYNEYYQILAELQNFGIKQLFVIDNTFTNIHSYKAPIFRMKFPIYSPNGNIGIQTNRPTVIIKRDQTAFQNTIDAINTVLPKIIPNMTIFLKDSRSYYDDIPEDDDSLVVSLMSVRGDTEIPLFSESEGVIKLISILSLLITAFNDKSCTVAIDELDSGVYEHLLGELLIAFDEYGKGQLIFTSHNLRPLEVLNKESLVFTTANAENRYIRLKGVGRSNNLRDLYLREILDCSQDEEIYSPLKRYRLVAAFQKAGSQIGKS